MKFGIVTFSTDQSIRPDKLAVIIEQLGFDSLFLTEHSNIPASRQTPYPGGGDLPEEYFGTYDPFIALMAAAAATKRIQIGTGMCLVAQRDPIHTAKSVATLDQLSDGRFLFGVGAGWNREEMYQHGTNPATRMKLLRERMLAIKSLWSEDIAEFHGDFVNIEPTTVRPAPVQRPHPPVIIGGIGPTVLDRVLEYGDAWAPNPGWPPMEDLAERIDELKQRAKSSGRGEIPVMVFGMSADAKQVEHYASIGVTSCVFLLPTLPEREAREYLDALAKIAGLS
jgi:probable F420-dependent oxidoreductase